MQLSGVFMSELGRERERELTEAPIALELHTYGVVRSTSHPGQSSRADYVGVSFRVGKWARRRIILAPELLPWYPFYHPA